jgi:ketosteroid isomerase-like protein
VTSPLKIVEALYATLFDSRAAIGEIFADDIRWYQAESHPLANPDGPWIGKDAIDLHVTAPLRVAFDNWSYELDELIPAAGDRVVATGRYVGVHHTSGTPISAQFCIIYSVKKGRITEARQYVDTAMIRAFMVDHKN